MIDCFRNIRRPFRALIVVGFTRPVGAGYNPTVLSGHKKNIVMKAFNKNSTEILLHFLFSFT
jgi:hypothetical protein